MKMRALVLAIIVGWIGFWFWAFSFAFSDNFFEYNLHSRLPTFLAALFCVSAIPLSALLALRQVVDGHRPPIAALGIHLARTIAAIAVPLAVMFVLARVPHPWRLEADDAMGVGIGFAALFLVAALSIVLLAIALVIRRARDAADHSHPTRPIR